MFGFGLPELIVTMVIVILIGGPIWAVISLRKRYPDKIWIGMVICLINAGIGQFWLPKGLKYFFLTYILYAIFVRWIGLGFIVVNLLSAGILYWRYLKSQVKPSLVPDKNEMRK